MFFTHRRFMRAICREALQHYVLEAPTNANQCDEPTWDIGHDEKEFYTATTAELGRLWAMLLAQAQAEGASRIILHYNSPLMIYTLAGTDYEIIPPPPPLNVDMARLLAKATKMGRYLKSTLPIQFADLRLTLQVEHHPDEAKPFLEISGFTGTPRSPSS